MGKTIAVNMDILEAVEKIEKYMKNNYLTIRLIDKYHLDWGPAQVISLVYEEYFARVSNRLVLSIIIDNLEGQLRLHSQAGGGQTGRFLNFDYGAAESFEGAVSRALAQYII